MRNEYWVFSLLLVKEALPIVIIFNFDNPLILKVVTFLKHSLPMCKYCNDSNRSKSNIVPSLQLFDATTIPVVFSFRFSKSFQSLTIDFGTASPPK